MKPCKDCGVAKTTDNTYTNDSRGYSYFFARCKKCHSAHMLKKYYERKAERPANYKELQKAAKDKRYLEKKERELRQKYNRSDML